MYPNVCLVILWLGEVCTDANDPYANDDARWTKHDWIGSLVDKPSQLDYSGADAGFHIMGGVTPESVINKSRLIFRLTI